MGRDTRRPILPAPTESIVDTTGGSTTGTDLATDISRRTDKTSYSIPDDGSPVIISTRRKHRSHGEDSKLSHSAQHSQTSLLIEYFEGGKGSGSGSGSGALAPRPSVRVRVTPSSSRKHKEHIQITDSSGKKSYSRRISFSSPSKHKGGDDQSIASSNSATDENHQSSGRPPVEIELVNREHGSELSTLSRDTRYIQPTSDISSMPADSMLEASSSGPRRKRSQSLDREQKRDAKVYLKTPSRQRSRSLSTERIAHRVAEKLSNDPREASDGKRQQLEKSKGLGSDIQDTDPKSSRRRLFREEEMSPESSLLSASAVSSHRKSGDQYSFRSGTSKSSINNPRLLETVEDAIRRLILPELKELKKDQKVISNTSKFERDMSASYSPTSSPSRDELGRRLSKHSSAPNVRKPKVVLNKDSRDEGILLSGEPTLSQKERRYSKDTEVTADGSYVKWSQRPELTDQEKLRRQKSKGLRDAEKAARVGSALTAAALKHHDSRSSIDRNEGRRASGSKSRSGSVNETELVFQKHNVAPMPLRSAIESDITRDSLLSEQTLEPATPRGDSSLQEVTRGSPRQLASPTSRTPARTSLDSRYELKHSNLSSHNLSIHSSSDQDLHEKSRSPESDSGAIAAAAAANLLDVHSAHRSLDFHDPNSRRRALSPIQSVASNQSDSHMGQEYRHSNDHAFRKDERELEPRLSIDSLSSAPSTNLARSTRHEGHSIASQSEMLRHHKESGPELGYEESPGASPRPEEWQEDSDDENIRVHRHSMAETTSTEARRMADDTDGSDVHYMEKVHQGQPVAGIGASPQFVHPVAVESAVASLLDPPSLLDTKSNHSDGTRSQGNEKPQSGSQSPGSMERDMHMTHGARQGSPLKQRQDAYSPDATSFPRRMGATSPPQSVTQSLEDQHEPAHMFVDRVHDDRDLDRSPDSESEINTNPSIIQGPAHENQWTYDRTPSKGEQSPLFDNTDAGAIGTGRALGSMDKPGYNPDYYAEDDYYDDQQYPRGQLFDTPSGAKDEGYVSAAHPISPSIDTPEGAAKGFGGIDANGMGLFDSPDDTFNPSHSRKVSGYSHGVGSPLYDSATGHGIEQIQSKDIIALMDHLTVRDAQRNARDTEILVTLVRSAAEMRNSFEEMKKFIAQQDDLLMDTSDRQHDRTYRALGGPRPLPTSASRSARLSNGEDGEDLRSKRKNVFKRALKGLSLKSSNDLNKIEEMLEQILEEVEGLRAGQDDRFPRSENRGASVDPEGYEPEGHAGSSSPGNHSGYLSMYTRPGPSAKGAENRVSTVHEADENLQAHERGTFLSPNVAAMENVDGRQERAGSEPVSTPPRVPVVSGALSNETTPKTNEKARKHKSSSSSFFPKISRWSKTTASSMGDNIRHSMQPARKDRSSFDASRSGSDLANGPYKTADYYDPQGDDRLRSNYTLDEQQQENRPPSPLVPSQVSEAPKYRAHRGSLDLQHPQPRQGPSGRYQSHLETQAQVYGRPLSDADQWGSNPSLTAANANQGYSVGSPLSPISDGGYSNASSRRNRQQGPPRPPKVKDDGPLIPERASRVSSNDEERSYVDRTVSRGSAVQASPHNTPPVRKPTGPRPLNSGSQYSPSRRKKTQYRGSPDQIDDEHVY
ncbi:hypothetical protein FE257_002925 [Aspergillus nanangensis]|uniref:Uncharacterized protein n=1 Tax=Aspergillus nanangensis TaxID=2582783 RepID=A0AAD4CUI6_ASPNN|nr:hypothetical protein FE257_002925 [Aspergillus nanangensis]